MGCVYSVAKGEKVPYLSIPRSQGERSKEGLCHKLEVYQTIYLILTEVK
jgi:hypothetical protein